MPKDWKKVAMNTIAHTTGAKEDKEGGKSFRTRKKRCSLPSDLSFKWVTRPILPSSQIQPKSCRGV
jgi:hypothetical protein